MTAAFERAILGAMAHSRKLCLAVAASVVACGSVASAATSVHNYQLRWPRRPSQSITYRLNFRSPRPVRSVTLRLGAQPVPRGFVFDNIVACAHKGPAFLDWDWAQSPGYVFLRVQMTTGLCSPGPKVGGKVASLHFSAVGR